MGEGNIRWRGCHVLESSHSIDFPLPLLTSPMSSSAFHSTLQFRAIFDAALNDYAQKTGIDLATHPLAAVLESCHSPEAILDVLREQAHAFNKYRNGDWKTRLMRHLNPTVDILLRLSTGGVLDEGISLVRHTNRTISLCASPNSYLSSLQTFPPAKAIFSGVGLLLAVRISSPILLSVIVTPEYRRRLKKLARATMPSSSSSKFLNITSVDSKYSPRSPLRWEKYWSR